MIIGFEFQIQERTGAPRWVRLMGSGGLLGDGALAALNGRTGTERGELLDRVKNSILEQARVPLRRGLGIRVLRSWDLPPADRFETLTPDSVLRVREIEA